VKSFLVLLFAAATAGAAPAEGDATERERLKAARSAIQARYAQEEKACQDRFAVNDCLDRARRTRNAALAQVRKDELALNEAERQRRAAERQEAVDERHSPERLQAEEERRAKARAEQAEREERAAEKRAKRAARQDAAAASPAQGEKEDKRPDAAEQAQNRARQDERAQEAEARKQRVIQRAAERRKPAASDLPVPP
jgi:colicin import membrane protein